MSKSKTIQQRRQRVRKRRTLKETGRGETQPAIAPSNAGSREGDVTQEDLLHLYKAGRYDLLSEGILFVLQGYNKRIFLDLHPGDQERIDWFVECLFYLLTRPDYVISPRYQENFFRYLPLITNLVAISRYETTDKQLEILRDQPNSLPKILALYSARNRVRIDYKWLFDQDPKLASLWYPRFFNATTSPHTQAICENLRYHLQNVDEKFELNRDIATSSMFFCTYIDPRLERSVKEKLNAVIRRKLANVRVINKPASRSIAILASSWSPTTVIYRGLMPFIKPLKQRYDLTLVHLGGRPIEQMDTRMFKNVRTVMMDKNGELNAESICHNDFQLVFYTEVGLSAESRYLSNLRIAPIQATCYGHPVSTRGSQIDYFLGGTEMEVIADAQRNYSERLVLIPGGLVFPTIPEYQTAGPARSDLEIVVNCAWTGAKCHWSMLMVLKKILKQIRKKTVFQFLPTIEAMWMNGFIQYKRDMESTVGSQNLRVLATQGDSYMQALETGHFSIDSYPFGAFTCVVDALHVGIPMVTWEGGRAYNMSASRLMRKAGLDELVATNEDEYIARVCRLIEDDAYRNELYERIRGLDLKTALFDPKEIDYFVKAIDYLIENHETLKNDPSREPIVISP
ncbi:MAG: tetratricopeptide repeat protein [Planctomycetota bacterium]|jgi:hypothetical protein